jgi:hypothetical protein
MAAPEFVPVPPTEKARAYESPSHVPDGWKADRPAEVAARQPHGSLLGAQGPDQGYGLTLAERFRDRLVLTPGEHADDVIAGALGIALRRASLFGRAPVVHDFTIAFGIWGLLDAAAPGDLVEARRAAFAELRSSHHYAERRVVADAVPDATLRMTPAQVTAAGLGRWRELTGWSGVHAHH